MPGTKSAELPQMVDTELYISAIEASQVDAQTKAMVVALSKLPI